MTKSEVYSWAIRGAQHERNMHPERTAEINRLIARMARELTREPDPHSEYKPPKFRNR